MEAVKNKIVEEVARAWHAASPIERIATISTIAQFIALLVCLTHK